MAEARGDTDVAAGDVVELQGTMTVDISDVHDGVGKPAIAADVEKEVVGSASALQKVTASSGAVHPNTPDVQPTEEQQVFALALL